MQSRCFGLAVVIFVFVRFWIQNDVFFGLLLDFKFKGHDLTRPGQGPANLKSNKNKNNNSQTEATTLQLLVFLLSCWIVVVYCSIVVQSLTLGRAVWEPWATTITPTFTFGVPCFSVCFLALIFSTKKHIFHKSDLQKDSQIHPKPGPVPIFADFLHSLFLMACAVFLIDFTASTC